MLRWPSVTLTDHLWLAAHISGIWRDCNAFQGSGRCPEVFHLKCHQLLGLRLHRDAGGSSNCIELGSAHILVWRPQKTFSWAKEFSPSFLQKGTFRHDVPCNQSSPSSGLRGSSSVMFAGWGRQLRWGCRKECVRAYDCTCTCTYVRVY